jgi:hypothetical protein
MVNQCPICHGNREEYFKVTLLKKYLVDYYFCYGCGLLQTEKPYWLDEAYSEAIADADTGLVQRNIQTSQELACLLFFLFKRDGKYVDLGGGYGLLTRLMRDIGFDFYWSDPNCKNILSKGFEADQHEESFLVATAFEVLEHTYSPFDFIRQSLESSSALILSTELFAGKPPGFDWWYYAFNTGQHISLFQKQTLVYMAEMLSLQFYSYRNIHIFSKYGIRNSFLIERLVKQSQLLEFFIKKMMKSKTFSDHLYVIDKP